MKIVLRRPTLPTSTRKLVLKRKPKPVGQVVTKSGDFLPARKVLMSSLLYYRAASPVLSDAEFDAHVRHVVEHYDELNDMMQWQLGPKEELLTSAHRCKITYMTFCGAVSWHEFVRKVRPPLNEEEIEWRYSERRGVNWIRAEG